MLNPGDQQVEIEKLRARRNQLFKQLVEHPSDFRVSLEIRKLDDLIAKLIESRVEATRQD